MTTTLLAEVRRMEAALVALSGLERKDELPHDAYFASHALSKALVEWRRTVGSDYFRPRPVTKNVPRE